MIERSCKMESITILITEDTFWAVLDACFGVSIDEDGYGRTYRAKDESVEIYSGYRMRHHNHYEECELQYSITFVLHATRREPDRKELIKFNQTYP
ncbi:hypothetical protein PENTCL1PPCAC_22177 [Pristionchus entomophagus]|uniref:CUB domain-containing protein n=1 Tax=Pristionchus entomophagus TaxID=358040 RepID=A0AAV5U063_9BILA|nr:hypothetical protein PENTCL1PPCAC_22177 [Pristionchus entomophagus]